jgi:general secretion pathway protein B
MPEPGPSARAAEAGPRVRIAVPGSDTVREVDVTRGSVPATRTAPPAAGSATRETVKAAVPANLPPSFQAAVSQLRLEALVYAQSPGDRKVFINGRRYLQGDTLDDGILVEKIVEEGAVLSYRGHRYVLRHFR